MSSTSIDENKRCKKCLLYVKTYITCFKCDAAYHIYCWRMVPGAHLNQTGQLFCCRDLTSNCAGNDSNLEDNPPERVIEKGSVDGYNEDLENRLIKEEDSKWNEFKCDTSVLEIMNKDYLENHYSEYLNKEGEFIQELKEDKDFKNCLHKEEDLDWNDFKCDACSLEFTNKEHLEAHYKESCNEKGEFIQELNEDKADLSCSFRNKENVQKESYEQLLRRCDIESSYSQLNKDNICESDTKRNPAQGNDEEKPFKPNDCKYYTYKKENLVRHIHTPTNEKSFKYDMYDYEAAENRTPTSHILRKHSNSEKKYKCTDCKFSTYKKDNLVIHERVHTKERPFKCDICDYEAAQKHHLKFHKLKHSNAEKEYKCTACEYSTYRKEGLVRHIHTHTNDKPFKCDICGYAAAEKQTLSRHILRRHSNAEKTYKCTDCKFSTYNNARLVIHNRVHTKERPFKCDICDYAAAWKNNLIAHIKAKHSNAEKEYKCTDCEYSAYRKEDLVKHIGTHANEKPFKCDMCDYAAAGKQSLSRHVLRKHSNTQKKYKCTECKFSTYYKAHLVMHKCVHTKERLFKCGICDYAATQRTHLNSHILRKHSNVEKKYKCTDCKFTAYDKTQLVIHKRVHSKERPFKCDICDYAAARKDRLKFHKLKHANAGKSVSAETANIPLIKKHIQ